MNKTVMKNFAVWARKKLREDITYKAGLLGVSEKGIAEPLPESSRDLQFFDIGTKAYGQAAGNEIKQRNALVHAIQEKARTSDYKTAFDAIIEEAAYTWFNRLLAIRLMEVNDYLPSRVRVLSSETSGKREPDLVTAPFDTDLEFTEAEQEKIMKLKDDASSAASDALFRMLFIKQCNKLHEILPELFEETLDYTELLLNISFTDPDGIVSHLINDIAEEDFDISRQGENGETAGQVEIIGWLYQYYNIELKDETFALLKKNVKITKERIPAATQLFTPDWIVRYMVENSLGRLWVEGHPSSDSLKENWKYYLEEAEQEADVQAALAKIREEHAKLAPEDLKVIDPCMGSGHILVYCFDVLMQIYESQGYTQRDAVQAIFEHNLFGLDIDKRAAQLTYFAVMIKGRQHDRRFFSRGIKPHIYAIEESNDINRNQLAYFGADLSDMEKNMATMQMRELLDTFTDAKEYGSILNVNQYDWDLLQRYVESVSTAGQLSFDAIGIEDTQAKLLYLLEIAKTMAQKYHVVVTNPPYMGSSGMSAKLSDYVKKNYPDSKADLFAVFIEHCGEMTKESCYQAMITQHAWMFLSSFEKLRKRILKNDIVNMAHLGARAFEEIGGEVVQTTSFVICNTHIDDYKGEYCRLIEPTTQQGKEEMFLAGENKYVSNQTNFGKIPGSPVAYWVSERIVRIFSEYPTIDSIAKPRQGLATGNNEKMLRLWYEVEWYRISTNSCNIDSFHAISNNRYIPYNKGGGFRKWYGNIENVIKFDLESYNFLMTVGNHLPSRELYFRESITWSKVTSGGLSMRYIPTGSAFDVAGCSIFSDENLIYILSLCNSSVIQTLAHTLSQTINYEVGTIKTMPVSLMEKQKGLVEDIAKKNINISKEDWDSYESSWDFKRNPLV